jgi:hypothetical protein
VNSAPGAARLVVNALMAAAVVGITGLLIVRADSPRTDLHTGRTESLRHVRSYADTARMTSGVTAAIARIEAAAWTPIRHPNAIWDQAEGRWICDAEVAEIRFPTPRSPATAAASTSPPG